MKVMNPTGAMPSPLPAGDDGPRLDWRCLNFEPVMSKDMRAKMVTMQMQLSRKKYRKPTMNQRRMWRTERIVLESVKIGLYISDL